MNSRQRVSHALDHQEPDRVPIDLGGCATTGMHVSTVYRLRQHLRMDAPGTPVKVIRAYLMLGEIGIDLMEALGLDVVSLNSDSNLFGLKHERWKEWRLPDGTPVLVPGDFNTEPDPDGSLYQYPQGDRSLPPSGVMPPGGHYFDAVIRQEPIDDERLDPDGNLEEFAPISEEKLAHFRRESERLWHQTDRAILANFGGTGFGDIALVPGTWLKRPRGIRDVAEWYLSLAMRPDYIREVFSRQCDVALENLGKIREAVGDRVTAAFVSGTDFGAQQSLLVSPGIYRDLFLPFHQRVNDWIHAHTNWKTFIHTCGAVASLIDDLVEAGFDILNPVQCSAAGMDPARLKARFGDRIVFWGGGVDTQGVLPHGSPDDVRRQVRERMRVFAPGGGYVFNPVHNVQAGTPVENLVAMFDEARQCGRYPIS